MRERGGPGQSRNLGWPASRVKSEISRRESGQDTCCKGLCGRVGE